ncbi:hypothetical protein ACQEVS_09780 [Streptomyces sp. CA-181903]|uniref:hypothetical protein n=1 Tax=Streptomyces sp. CA-181903 TaxID=3240055 RepID=UPI003D92F95C
MGEGMQAGRLEVPVVADLHGFAEELRAKIEAVTEGLKIKIPVKIADKGLRERLETAVKEASTGVSAKIKVKLKDKGLRQQLDEAVQRASARGHGITVPVRPDDAGHRGAGFLGRLHSLVTGAQGEADRNPVRVPVQIEAPTGGRMRGGRRLMRTLAMGSIVSVIGPALGALTQYGAALTALVSAASPAVGVLGGIPGLIAAAGTAAIGTKVAFSGFGEALKQTFKNEQQLAAGTKVTAAQQQALAQAMGDVSASAKKTILAVAGVRGEWKSLRMSVQERFFSKIKNEIDPLSKKTLPLLKSSLGDAAGQMGTLAQRGARFMQTGVFARDFRTVAKTNAALIGNFSGTLRNLGHATLDFLVASGPFARRLGNGTERLSRYIRASTAAGRETGSLAKFLDHAGDKANQLGRSTKWLGKGLAAVGRAGMESGNALLDGFEGTLLRFNRWARSDKGQMSMKTFFADAGPTFHELNGLVGDFFRGLGRMARSNGITDLVRQIRTELMPGVGAFFDSIGKSVGPSVISLISNLARAFATLSAAGTGLGTLLLAFNGLLSLFNGLMRVVPGLGTALGTLIGALMALKIVTGITGTLGRFGTTLRGLATASSGTTAVIGPQIGAWQRLSLAASQAGRAIPGAMRGAGAAAGTFGAAMRNVVTSGSAVTTAMGPQISTWQRMQAAYRSAAAGAGTLGGAMRNAGAAVRAAGFGVGGLVNALGGPLGAALTVATIGVGLWASSQEKAARATAAHEDRVNALSRALKDSGGAIDANVRSQAAQLLQETKVADGHAKLTAVMDRAGIGLGKLTDAYLGPKDALEKLQKQLEDTARAHTHLEQIAGNRETRGMKSVTDETGKRAKAAADALKSVRGELEGAIGKNRELEAATKGVGGGTDAFNRLKAAVNGLSSETSAADEKVTSLKRALDAITGNTESFHDAQTRLNAAVLSVNEAIEQGNGKIPDAAQKLLQYDGSINTASRAGQEFNSRMKEIRESAMSAAVAAQQMAKENGVPIGQAMKTAEAEMSKARQAAVSYAQSLGLPKQQAEELANRLGLMPKTVSMLFQAQGMSTINAEMLQLQARLSTLKQGQTITIKAPTGEAIAALRAVGYEVTSLPGGRVRVTASTGEARSQLAMLVSAIAATPSDKNVSVKTLIGDAVSGLTSVRDQVVSLPADRTVKVDAPTGLARAELEALGYKITDIPGSKQVAITAPTGTAISQVQAIQSQINSLTGKTVDVTIRYNNVGKPYVNETQKKDGGIVRFSKYANGGISRAAGKLKAFAQGTERHVAQIARAGTWRLWAEPETGGEAYIPLGRAKRARSEAILDAVAQEFGGQVIYPRDANGQDPSALYRSARSSVSMRPTVPRASTSLVGGDLKLVMTGAPMSPSAAINDAMFELRRIQHGGAHV